MIDKNTREIRKRKYPMAQKIRLAVQIFFFGLIALLTSANFLSENGIASPIAGVSLHAICPFGGVVTAYQYLTIGTFVQKIHESSFVLMVIVLLLSILFGPVICGWVCPLGSLQEWIGKLGKKLFKKRYNNFIPYKVDRVLRFLRYFVLIWVVYVTATTAKLAFQTIDPYYALFNFYSGEVAISAFVILGVTILLSLFIERPWCKYACPYGAFQGIFNFLRIFKIHRSKSTCTGCKACDHACPMNIKVSQTKAVRDHQCISCLKCTSENACPIANTVEMSLLGEKQDKSSAKEKRI